MSATPKVYGLRNHGSRFGVLMKRKSRGPTTPRHAMTEEQRRVRDKKARYAANVAKREEPKR